MSFTKQNLLQINATVIAGILILVSIQSSTSLAPRDVLVDGLILVRTGELDLEGANNFREALKEKNAIISNETSKIIFELEYDRQLETRHETNQMLARQQVYEELHPMLRLFLTPSFLATVLIIPFAVSSTIELGTLLKNKEEEKPTDAGIISSIMGFVTIFLIFFANLVFPMF